jgi:ApeA N-terminal domain 1
MMDNCVHCEPGGEMTKSLELDGEFWLPDDPDTKVVGIVTFSPPKGATLSLIGSFSDFMDRLDQRPSPDYRRIVGAVIFRGNITNVTLDDCRLTFDNPFGRRQRFVVSRMLINVAYDRNEPVELDRLTVRLSDFPDGWRRAPLRCSQIGLCSQKATYRWLFSPLKRSRIFSLAVMCDSTWCIRFL